MRVQAVPWTGGSIPHIGSNISNTFSKGYSKMDKQKLLNLFKEKIQDGMSQEDSLLFVLDKIENPDMLPVPTKPEWRIAPKWANFLAMNEYGFWCWFQTKPEDGYVGHWNTDDNFEVAVEGVNQSFPFWRKTLEARPIN